MNNEKGQTQDGLILNRRDFLKVAGTSAIGGLVLSGCSLAVGESFKTPPNFKNLPLDIKYVPSVCLQCPGGCGILVKVVNGKAVKIDGLPGHPVNEGKVCPKCQAGLQVLYDPDRIKGPLKRMGERGEGKFESISWEQALNEIAEKLRGIRKDGQPHSLVMLTGRVRGSMGVLIERFMKAFGSPNNIGHSNIGCDGAVIAHYLTQGIKDYLAYDWWNTNYVLDFGGSILESWRPTTMLLRAWGHMRSKPYRTKIVVVEARGSNTALKADEWISIKPGTDGALALAIAYVIIKNRLYDEKFIMQNTEGFDKFKELVLSKYSPQWASKVTGIKSETIERIAMEFANAKPFAFAAGHRGAIAWKNGLYNYMAIHSLNALIGTIGVRGGVIVQDHPPLARLPEIVPDNISKKGLSNVRVDLAESVSYPLARNVYHRVSESVLKEKPYKVRALFMYYTDPFFSSPNCLEFYRMAQKPELIVSFSPFLSDGTLFCDYILPDDTYLERIQDDIVNPSVGYPVVSMRYPVVRRLFDTRNTGDVLIELAKKVGWGPAKAFEKWDNFESILYDIYKGVWESKRGNFTANKFSEWWKKFIETGVWFDKPYRFFKDECPEEEWRRFHFRNESGKFEFYSHKLLKALKEYAEKAGGMNNYLPRLGVKSLSEEAFLPHYEEPQYDGEEREYPLHLLTYKPITHAEGRGANIPNLQEILGVHVSRNWKLWVEINPETASELGIRNGDSVWIESSLGKIKAVAKLFEGTRPDCVNIPFELGHKAYGRWAKNRGANPNEIMRTAQDNLSGIASFHHMRVKIYRA